MKATLVFVPPGGGEADYSLDFEIPSVPQPGDYVSIKRPGQQGTIDFIVRRTWWHMEYPSDALYGDPDNPIYGSVTGIVVECEFAIGPYSSPEHKQSCESYKGEGKLQKFEDTAF
jgi:hypothetical protein